MSISDLFDSGFRARNKDHFAAIVRVTMSDGVITDDEKTFLDRLASNLDISKDEYSTILKDYKSHPINPPVDQDRRFERFYDLTRMVWADHIEGENQFVILRKLCIGLGFDSDKANALSNEAINLVYDGVDFDTFKAGLLKIH